MSPLLKLKTILVNDRVGCIKNESLVMMLPEVTKYMVHLFYVTILWHYNTGGHHLDLTSDVNESQIHSPSKNPNQ